MADPPKPAEPADTAEGGQPLEPKPLEKKEDKYEWGSTKVEEAEPEGAEEAPPEETFSIAIELQDDQKKPKPVSTMPKGGSVEFSITVGEETKTGQLDDKGKAKIEGLPKKPCKVSFPKIDKNEWEFVKKK
jgi:hypothetical protein